jgi:glycosyltransferase involved in cell wall biosynthesis
MISFIMPIKDTAPYIAEAIEGILAMPQGDWELIGIDDHSIDDSYAIIKHYSDSDVRIKIYRNIGKGKIEALNYGYSKSKGQIIKCIDSDDILGMNFLDELPQLADMEAHCHAGQVFGQNMKRCSQYNVNRKILFENYEVVLNKLISIPKWSWTVTRALAGRIFPIPNELPFEDVWFSLVIKKYSSKIMASNMPLYRYRQRDGQTYGGILNYDSDVICFRAARILKVIDIIESDGGKLINGVESNFEAIREYYRTLVKRNVSYLSIIRSNQKLMPKLRIVLLKKMPIIAQWLTLVKWRFDKLSL